MPIPEPITNSNMVMDCRSEITRLRDALQRIHDTELSTQDAPFDVWDKLTNIAEEALNASRSDAPP